MPPVSKPANKAPFKPTPPNKPAVGAGKGPKPAARKPAPSSGDEHGSKNISSALEELDDVYQGAQAKEGGNFERLPDGKYQAKITGAKVEHSKTSARLQATFELTIASGEYANRKVWKRDGLDNEESIGWFKGGLARLGVEAPARMAEVPEVLESLVDTFCEINIKNKDDSDWSNVYFNKALDSGDIVEEGLESADGGDGEVQPEEPSEKQWSVGDQVQADFNGDWYTGEVKKANNKTRMATVLFEDGETQEMSFDDLEIFDPGEDATTEPPASLLLNFDDTKVSEAQQKQVDVIARKHGFNPDDYAEWVPLMSDLGEHCGITGEFVNAASFIKSVSAVKVS